jgi:hypothetical protein
MGNEMDGRVSIPGRGKVFYLIHNIETGFEVHPASYPIGTGSDSPGVKTAGV